MLKVRKKYLKKYSITIGDILKYIILIAIFISIKPNYSFAGERCKITKRKCNFELVKQNYPRIYYHLVDAFIKYEEFTNDPELGTTTNRNNEPIIASMYGTGDGFKKRRTASGYCMDPDSYIMAISKKNGNLKTKNSKLGGLYGIRTVTNLVDDKEKASLVVAADIGSMKTKLTSQKKADIMADIKYANENKKIQLKMPGLKKGNITRQFDLSESVADDSGVSNDGQALSSMEILPPIEFENDEEQHDYFDIVVPCVNEYNRDERPFQPYINQRYTELNE